MHAPVGHAAEPGVGDDGDVFAERQVTQRAGDLIGLFHAGAHRPAADQHEHVAGLRSRFALIAAIAARSDRNTFAGPVIRYTPSASTTDGSIAVLLMTDAFRREIALRETDRGRQAAACVPRRATRSRRPDRRLRFLQLRAQARPSLGRFPRVELRIERVARHRQ